MAGRTDGLIKAFKAAGTIGRRLIVKMGTADDEVVVATASTDGLLGVSAEIDVATGERVDVVMSNIAEVIYGGTVTRLDWLTSDATGRAVAAVPSAGVNANVLGQAMVSGVVGDVGVVHIAKGRIQG